MRKQHRAKREGESAVGIELGNEKERRNDAYKYQVRNGHIGKVNKPNRNCFACSVLELLTRFLNVKEIYQILH